MRALEHLETLSELSRGQDRSWLCKTARNVFLDGVCRTACAPREPEPEQQTEAFNWMEISKLLHALPELERALFSL